MLDLKYSSESNKSFENTVLALEESLSKHKFGVLWKLDVRDQLNKKGLDTDIQFHIFEVCNAAKAKEVLEQNILVGYFLPCKIVVYSSDEKTIIGMIRPATIVSFLEDQSLEQFAKEVEDILIAAINDASGKTLAAAQK